MDAAAICPLGQLAAQRPVHAEAVVNVWAQEADVVETEVHHRTFIAAAAAMPANSARRLSTSSAHALDDLHERLPVGGQDLYRAAGGHRLPAPLPGKEDLGDSGASLGSLHCLDQPVRLAAGLIGRHPVGRIDNDHAGTAGQSLVAGLQPIGRWSGDLGAQPGAGVDEPGQHLGEQVEGVQAGRAEHRGGLAVGDPAVVLHLLEVRGGVVGELSGVGVHEVRSRQPLALEVGLAEVAVVDLDGLDVADDRRVFAAG